MGLEFVKKRDGSTVEFNSVKIKKAVRKAASAVDLDNETIGEEITQEVISYLKIFFGEKGIPEVEQIQDLVEKVLIEKGYAEVAKAYILYREQHNKLRDTKKMFNDAIKTMNNYLDLVDWKVRENSNMSYSLQGLNNFISSEVTSQYWLQEIYPEKAGEKHLNGDFHIHDLGNLSVYCCGWDLEDFLRTGFRGVPTKIESDPPKHLKTALGQMVNFFFTLQGEAAGAMAFSNFDTLLAPFVAYDNLSYKEVKQAMQEFLFNMNVPTRVGFQCLSEDTKILTKDGWKNHNEVKRGDTIRTFNTAENIIEDKKVKKVFDRYYEGEMYNLKNIIQDQLISPGHRVVRKKFNTVDDYCLEEIEDIYENFKTPPIIPISANNNNPDIELLDEEIKLLAWIIAEGTMEVKGDWRRITIYQTKKHSPENYEEIISLINLLGLDYTEQEGSKSLGDTVTQVRVNAENSRHLLKQFDNDKSVKNIPEKLLAMSQRQSRIFLETYIKSDGHENNKITTSSPEILEALQTIIVNSGYGFTVNKRMASGVGNKLLYIIRVIRHQDTYIKDIKKVNYQGHIWSVNTDNETVIAKRNGKVFITGNTPFTNITMDLKVPKHFKEQPVTIGGEMKERTYGEFQEEMDLINKAFAEVMMSGDSKGRVFSFPIPTYNITPDFDWDNPVLNPVWEMTAKFGIPYFSNFVNSDMDPEDARSMCLYPDETMMIKVEDDIKKCTIGEIFEEYKGEKLDAEWYLTYKSIETLSLNSDNGKLEWAKINKFLKIRDNKIVKITAKDGKTMRVSADHLVGIYKGNKICTKTAKRLNKNDLILSVKNSEQFNQDVKTVSSLLLFDNDLGYDDIKEISLEQNVKKLKTSVSKDLRNSDFVITEIKSIQKEELDYQQLFYDIELNKNHYFVHSDGNITHNCCRLRLDNRELRKRGGGLFGANPMTGSIGVVTLNMPRIGYLANNKKDYMNRVYELMDLAKESLEIKRKVLENLTEQGLYPYSKFYLRNIKKRFDEYWKNHFNTIGINGMNESLENFMGKDITDKEAHEFTVEVMEKMKSKMREYQEETGNLYNLEATPAESTSYRLAKLDKERFGNEITAANEQRIRENDAEPYYTNSTHLPVGYTDDIFDALEIQDDLQAEFTGGTVFHGFLGERLNGIESTKKLVRRIAANFKLPYYTITPTFSICPVHGYIPGEHKFCPKCEAEERAKASEE
ncbi:MAG TPA: anaerobic ribonucleoside-triphosphate reductase [Halanaerobiales bacterium]|nr:anaerobic ribonucleoside-triphosphate reductase [Halanaerobiales bacterium]